MKYSLPAVCLSALLLAACTPTASVRYLSPTISGKITQADTPAVDVTVKLSVKHNDKTCLSTALETRTNTYGEFNLVSVKKKLDYTPLMEHYLDEWNICIVNGGTSYPVYSNNRYGQGSVNQDLQLQCNIPASPDEAPVCKVRTIAGERDSMHAY